MVFQAGCSSSGVCCCSLTARCEFEYLRPERLGESMIGLELTFPLLFLVGLQWETYVPSFVDLTYLPDTHPPSSHRLRDRKANAIQILFLCGLTLIIGIQKTLLFFARRQKLKGTAAFAGGILLILFRWPLIGFIVELYGIFVLFGKRERENPATTSSSIHLGRRAME
jgi:hypothetical protein